MKRKLLFSPLIIVILIIIAGIGIASASIYLGTSSGGETNTVGVNLQKGLVGWWDFNGNAKDASPNSNHGTVTGASLTTDRKGAVNKAYLFNGTNGYINVGNNSSLSLGSEMTLVTWINIAQTNRHYVFQKSGEYVVSISSGTNLVEACVSQNGIDITTNWWVSGATNLNFTFPSNPSGWHQIVIVIGNGRATGYVDGQYGSYASWAGNPYNPSRNLLIGGNGGTYGVNGSLDDARIYNRALSQAEVTALYNSYDSGVVVTDLQKGLVGSWDFNGNAKDITPYSSHGTVHGAALVPDRKGELNRAYSFNATNNDYIDMGNTATLKSTIGTGSFSVSVWVKTTQTPANAADLVWKYWPGFLVRLNSSGGITFYFYDGTYNPGKNSSVIVNDGVWHHVVAVRDKSITKILLYVDSVEQTPSVTDTTVDLTSNNSFLMGIPMNFQWYNGSLDDVRIWNRALSQTEIADLYNSYDPGIVMPDLQKGLVGSWDFNGNAKDITPNSNHGSVVGAALTPDRKGELNKAYVLNGTSGYISAGTGASLNISSAITVAGWVKFNGLDYVGSTGTLIFIGAKGYPDAVDPNAGWWFAYDNRSNGRSFGYTCFGNSAGGYAGGGNNFSSSSYSNTFTSGVWYHLAFTISSSTAKLYINGVQKGPDLALSNLVLSSPASPLYFGTTAGLYFNGSMDDMRVYNRALTPAEITALYQSYE